MDIEDRNSRNKVYMQFRASVDIGMGFLYVFVSFYAMRVPFIIAEYGSKTVWTIAGLFIFYGIFRILRAVYAIWQMMKRARK